MESGRWVEIVGRWRAGEGPAALVEDGGGDVGVGVDEEGDEEDELEDEDRDDYEDGYQDVREGSAWQGCMYGSGLSQRVIEGPGNDIVQDYEMQLMLFEQQNKSGL